MQPDFLYSVSRDFIKNCRTPMLVLPDDVPGHPLQTSIDVASLAPNAEITVFPWKEPEELRQRTIDRVRRFLQAHIPMRAAAQYSVGLVYLRVPTWAPSPAEQQTRSRLPTAPTKPFNRSSISSPPDLRVATVELFLSTILRARILGALPI